MSNHRAATSEWHKHTHTAGAHRQKIKRENMYASFENQLWSLCECLSVELIVWSLSLSLSLFLFNSFLSEEYFKSSSTFKLDRCSEEKESERASSIRQWETYFFLFQSSMLGNLIYFKQTGGVWKMQKFFFFFFSLSFVFLW